MSDASEANLPESEDEWREVLTEEEYRVLREAGTEPAFSGDYLEIDEDGVFRCAGCGVSLFSAETKYKSGSGWPSFWEAVSDDRIETEADLSMGRDRTEILCARCGGHLGHVFEDGPDPTGKRYCVNSAAIDFDPEA